MSVRLVVTLNAAPGKGSELARVFRDRCAEVMQEPGCEQFEVFQSVLNPDKLALLELWTDQAALAASATARQAETRKRRAMAAARLNHCFKSLAALAFDFFGRHSRPSNSL